MGNKNSSGSAHIKRIQSAVKELMDKGYRVELYEDQIDDLIVWFHGPEESLYAGGVWKVRVRLSSGFPNEIPTVRFLNKIFHPNIDDENGLVCFGKVSDWAPSLWNIFEHILPFLLLNPNPEDPLSLIAAESMIRDLEDFKKQVKDHVDRYAKNGE